MAEKTVSHQEVYSISKEKVITALEDIADSCIDSRFWKDFTVKGIASGMAPSNRRLLRSEEISRFNYTAEGGSQLFESLTTGALQLLEQDELHLDTWFSPRRLVRNFSQETVSLLPKDYETVELAEYSFWHFRLDYDQSAEGRLAIQIEPHYSRKRKKKELLVKVYRALFRDPVTVRIDKIPEFGTSMIAIPLYKSFTKAEAVQTKANKDHNKVAEVSRKAEKRYRQLVLKDAPKKEQAEARKERDDLEKSDKQKWEEAYKARQRVDYEMRKVALYLILNHWGELNLMERRSVDIQASDGQIGTPLIEEVISGLISGKRLEDEAALVEKRAKIDDDFCSSEASFYGYDSYYNRKWLPPNAIFTLGSQIFGVQRILSHFFPGMLADFLKDVPKHYGINRNAITSYVNEVVGKYRAHIIDHQGVRLTLKPHIDEPYSDSEWEKGLERQLEAAPEIAATLIKECSSLIAVTKYGSITKKDKDYLMFHPKWGVHLGACFKEYDQGEINRVIEIAEDTGEKLGLEVITGTSHEGFSNWLHSAEKEIALRFKNLDNKAKDGYFGWKPNCQDGNDIEMLLEMQFQLLDSEVLIVRDEEAFKRIQEYLRKFRLSYSTPIFQRVRFLYQHFENGYPYPVEYEGPFK